MISDLGVSYLGASDYFGGIRLANFRSIGEFGS